MKIPKIAYAIWVGEKRRMSDQDIVDFLRYVQQNPDLAFNLWIDLARLPPEITGFDDYFALFRKMADELNQKDPEHAIDIDEVISRIRIWDITAEGVSSPYVRYEIDRLRPNYGRASDLLRYKIFTDQKGGLYFDTDVGFSDVPIQDTEIFTKDNPQDVFWFDHNYGGNPRAVSNDLLATTPGHPFCEYLLETAEKNYNRFSKVEDSALFEAYYGDDSNCILDATIADTGPKLLDIAFSTFASHEKETYCELSFKFIDPKWRKKVSSHMSWHNMPVVKVKNAEIAIERALESLIFEVNVRSFLRLETHIQNVLEACDGESQRDEITERFFQRIRERKSEINFDGLRCAQLTYQNPKVIEFYKELGIPLTKSFTLPLWDTEQLDDYLRNNIEWYRNFVKDFVPIKDVSNNIALIHRTKGPVSSATEAKLMRGLTFISTFLDECEKIERNEENFQETKDYLQRCQLGYFVGNYQMLLSPNVYHRLSKNLCQQIKDVCGRYKDFIESHERYLKDYQIQRKQQSQNPPRRYGV